MMKPDEREAFFRILREANPEPRSELVFSTPYELLVAVVLSAQATDRSVNLATGRLYPVANTPASILALGEERLQAYIRTIGLFRTKAKNVIALSRILLQEHGGEVPRTREALEKLPGVGRKTANVVLNVAYGEPAMAVDTHIFRVSNRTGLAPGKDPLSVELKLLKVVPAAYRLHAHHWLILHGRYTCLARLPRCGECAVYAPCGFGDKAKIAAPPVMKKRVLPKSPLPARRKAR
jgi:endonuclease-3